MQSNKIKEFAARKEAARQQKEDARDRKRQNKINKVNNTPSRIEERTDETSHELIFHPRRFITYFQNFELDSFWFIYVTLIVLPIFLIPLLGPVFTDLLGKENAGLALLLTIFVQFDVFAAVFFVVIKIIRPAIHLVITNDNLYMLYGRNSDKPIAAGKKSELRFSTSLANTSAWSNFLIMCGSRNKDINRLSLKDRQKADAFMRRCNIRH